MKREAPVRLRRHPDHGGSSSGPVDSSNRRFTMTKADEREPASNDENWPAYVVAVCLGLLAMMLVGQLPLGR
jgi:hypothetical protein